MDKSLKEILLATGTSDIAYRREVVKRVLYKVSNLLATGTKLIPTTNYSVLDVVQSFPDEGVAAEYPVPEGSTSQEGALAWTDFSYKLDKGEAKFTITDESVLRGTAQQQNRRSFMRAAESMAKKEDANILSKLFAGAGQTQAVANLWTAAAGTPANDIVNAWGLLMKNSNMLDAEQSRVWVVLPSQAFTVVNTLQEINNINQRVKDWLESSFGLHIVGSRDTTIATTGMMLVNSAETGEHGVLNTNQIPLAEDERVIGVGTRYLVKKYFNTKVVPTSDSVATTQRIVKFGTTV